MPRLHKDESETKQVFHQQYSPLRRLSNNLTTELC